MQTWWNGSKGRKVGARYGGLYLKSPVKVLEKADGELHSAFRDSLV